MLTPTLTHQIIGIAVQGCMDYMSDLHNESKALINKHRFKIIEINKKVDAIFPKVLEAMNLIRNSDENDAIDTKLKSILANDTKSKERRSRPKHEKPVQK